MEFKVIPIPGISTHRTGKLSVSIAGKEETDITLTLSYQFYGPYDPTVDYVHKPKQFGEIVFNTVIEYRFFYDEYPYDDFPEIKMMLRASPVAGLDEIIGSPYVENMLSKTMFNSDEDRMGGGGIKESDVRHFRIGFDKYGQFDVLALGVDIREYEK